ncbi:MAG: hypothetical protein AAFY91_07870 [Bacteroidota bacterium]
MSKYVPTLPTEVAQKYLLVDWPSPHPELFFGPKIGTVDLRTITLQQADALAAHQVKFLQLKETKSTKPAASSAPDEGSKKK